MSDQVTKLNSREKFKVGFSFLMACPRQMIPVTSLYDTINDETFKFDSIINLTSMKTSTCCIKPHQSEAKEAEDIHY